MNELILTKDSSEEQIKTYFNTILALKEKNESYPVNIDDVWALVYSERGKATRALKTNFIENEDYILFAQNGKNLNGRPFCFEKFKRETKLEIAERNNILDKVYNIISNMLRERKVA